MFSKSLPFLVSILFLCELQAQQKNLIIYDVATKKQIIRELPRINNTIISEKTNAFQGLYNDAIQPLDLEMPQENIYKNTTFTDKIPVQSFTNIRQYPFSTAIKLIVESNGKMFHSCSAVMISSRHVMTAAHCFINSTLPNELFLDSIFAIPMFDNGTSQVNIPESQVQKIYFFEDWNVMEGEDIIILELDKPIGEITGWLGVGFNENDMFFEQNNFHKLSYPGEKLFDDNVDYNGDTLYYSYGQLGFNPNKSTSTVLGVQGHNGGRPGESGSPIFYTNNLEDYTNYGVLNLVGSSHHSRIQDWQYFAIKTIIKESTTPIIPVTNNAIEFNVFPNPTANRVNLRFKDLTKNHTVLVLNANGKRIQFIEIDKGQLETNIDLTNEPSGVYFFNISNGETISSKEVLKM